MMKLARFACFAGTVYEKAYREGAVGASYIGQTLVRATGLSPSRHRPQRSSVREYSRLNSLKPCSVKGAGERSSQAQKAFRGRPIASRCASIRAKPSSSASGRARRARSISKPGSAATPPEYWNTALM
jgi:hypothetical protein